MTTIRLVALAGLTTCFIFGVLRAEGAEPADELVAFLSGINSLQGRFKQRQFDDAHGLVHESSGRFRLLRPGYFAWQIESPDSQLVIADPWFIWHYDRDLETVTRRPVSGNTDTSPLQILGGDEAVLRQQFAVKQPAPDRFLLTPRSGESGFRELILDLEDETLVGMEIINRLNQQITIEFLELDREPGLSPADFVFEPPPGADLFYYEQ
jgi:outer membrane lipoprotein carrier protein